MNSKAKPVWLGNDSYRFVNRCYWFFGKKRLKNIWMNLQMKTSMHITYISVRFILILIQKTWNIVKYRNIVAFYPPNLKTTTQLEGDLNIDLISFHNQQLSTPCLSIINLWVCTAVSYHKISMGRVEHYIASNLMD